MFRKGVFLTLSIVGAAMPMAVSCARADMPPEVSIDGKFFPAGDATTQPSVKALPVGPSAAVEDPAKDVEEDQAMTDEMQEPAAIPAGQKMEPSTQPTTMPTMP